jgi:hypothetical protein
MARFWVTLKATVVISLGNTVQLVPVCLLVSCFPRRQSYYPEQRKGSFPGHVGLLGSKTRLASCPTSRMTSSC